MTSDQATARERPGRRIALGLLIALVLHLGLWWAAAHAPKRTPPKPPEQVSVQIVEIPPPPPKAPAAPVPAPTPPAPPPARVERHPRVTPPPPQLATPVPSPKPSAPPDKPPEKEPSDDHPLADAKPAPAAPGTPDAPGSRAPPGTSPGGVRLFDPSIIGRSLARNGSPGSHDDSARGNGDGDADTPAAEQARVGSRVNGFLDEATQAGRVSGGVISSCDDGLDNNTDGEIDCADPGCREMPVCKGTGVFASREPMVIPDGSQRGVESTIDVEQEGAIRKLSLLVRLKHGSPGDLSIELVSPEGTHAILRRADRNDGHFNKAFYVREFNGRPAAGRWTLIVRDAREGTQGTLTGWDLFLTSGNAHARI